MSTDRLLRQLDQQEWRCAAGGACAVVTDGHRCRITPGDALAVNQRGQLIHLRCAHIGNAPHRIRR